ncbi:glycosyltransferase family 4 protein [Marinoscillum pacificum]|uniref:glycosyltransferase family 4 protein n=1 Tax=Marinoscillum pacificum TaxID=392723 RepID=UPI0021577ED9|nr:glycosyltransferase family 4 protein [Marinoscillum pacificum]
MKILIFNSLYTDFVKGGAERSVKFLAESLVNNNVSVTVVALTNKRSFQASENGVFVQYLKNRNVYWAFDESNKNRKINRLLKYIWHLIEAFNIFQYHRLRKLIKDEAPDVVHTNNITGFSPIIWFICKNLKIPVVHTIRDYYLICSNSNMLRHSVKCEKQCSMCRIFTATRRIGAKNIDVIAGISNKVIEVHESNGYITQPNVLIYNQLHRLREKEVRSNKHAGLVFGYLGRLSVHKGIEVLLNAFSFVTDENVRLIIGGNGDKNYVDYLKRKYDGENIEYIGHVDKDLFFKKIDALVVPSIWDEPFGRIILEAYQYNLPVIGSKNGAIPELVKHEKSGILYSNETELIKVLVSFKENYSNYDWNISEVLSAFQDRDIAQDYISLFDSLTNIT